MHRLCGGSISRVMLTILCLRASAVRGFVNVFYTCSCGSRRERLKRSRAALRAGRSGGEGRGFGGKEPL